MVVYVLKFHKVNKTRILWKMQRLLNPLVL